MSRPALRSSAGINTSQQKHHDHRYKRAAPNQGQVCAKLGFKSLTSLYELARRHDDFPKPQKAGASQQSVVRYVRSELQWQAGTVADYQLQRICS